MDHLALKVSDQERARRFYETYCGFGARPPRRYDDDTLMLYDGDGFALALGMQEFEPPSGSPSRTAMRCARWRRGWRPTASTWSSAGTSPTT